jgi:hypothetical protein
MSRSLTLQVPSPRRVLLIVIGIVVAVAVIFAVARLTASILAPSPVMRVAADGNLHEVQVLGGTVYLGTVVADDGSALRLARPAVIRSEQAPAASGDVGNSSRIVVQSLATDPFGIAADIVIPLDNVTLVGVVQPNSSLGRAYTEAIGVAPAAPSASP